MLTIAEMLKSGTTSFLEAMLTHGSGIDNFVRAVKESGSRACLVCPRWCWFPFLQLRIHTSRDDTHSVKGKLVKCVETNTALNMKDARDKDMKAMSIESALAAHKNFHGAFEGRLLIWMACATPRGNPMSAHKEIGEAAENHNMGVTMHCAEAPKDLEIYRSEYKCSPMQFCQKTNLASKRTVLAHMVHPDSRAGDFKITRDSGTTISHNQTSNCKLGSGISPIPDILGAGVNVSLGTDGAPCNNTYDMFRAMHLASLIHSGKHQKAGILDAMAVLEIATINGARGLGFEKEIGSLGVGKKADFVIVNAEGLYAAPWDATQVTFGGIDPVTVVVHSSTWSDVETVIVNGVTVIED